MLRENNEKDKEVKETWSGKQKRQRRQKEKSTGK